MYYLAVAFGGKGKGMSTEKELLRAAKSGDLATVRKLLKKDPKLIQARDTDGSTPLHCAVWKGHLPVVEFLLTAGADVNAENKNDHWGTTPLHAAAHANQRAIAAMLLEHGANIKKKNLNKRTPLDETTFHNASATAKLLREKGG